VVEARERRISETQVRHPQASETAAALPSFHSIMRPPLLEVEDDKPGWLREDCDVIAASPRFAQLVSRVIGGDESPPLVAMEKSVEWLRKLRIPEDVTCHCGSLDAANLAAPVHACAVCQTLAEARSAPPSTVWQKPLKNRISKWCKRLTKGGLGPPTDRCGEGWHFTDVRSLWVCTATLNETDDLVDGDVVKL
jgi:hypothetical protein